MDLLPSLCFIKTARCRVGGLYFSKHLYTAAFYITWMKPIYITLAILLVAGLLISPIVAIWALNTLFVGVLFTAEIPLTLWTYLAMLWISVMMICAYK